MTQKTLSRRPVSAAPAGALTLTWAKATHQGPRAENQDASVVSGLRDATIARKGVVLMVCDGVGGAQGGRRASEIASTVAHQAYLDDSGTNPLTAIGNAIQKANAAVKEEAARNPAIASMATTIVMASVIGNTVYIGHAGDSRGYIFRADGRNEHITRDHSWVGEQVARGVMTEQQARENPMRNMITRSLGAAANNTPDLNTYTLAPGDVIVLCTDGLHGVVLDDQIRAILKRSPSAQKAADDLVAQGLANKTNDNTTAVVAMAAAAVVPVKKGGFPIGLLAAIAGILLLGAIGLLALLSRPSGGTGEGGTTAIPAAGTRIVAPTARATSGSGVQVGAGDATPTAAATLDPLGPTATLAPDLPTPTPIPTRAPVTLAPATPTDLPAAATATPSSGGSQPTSPPGPTSPPAATATTGPTPTQGPTATPQPPTETPLPPTKCPPGKCR